MAVDRVVASGEISGLVCDNEDAGISWGGGGSAGRAVGGEHGETVVPGRPEGGESGCGVNWE